MPFDANGNYTAASGATSAVAGAVIRSATWNSIFTDLQTALTAIGNAHAVNNAVSVAVGTPANTNETTLMSIPLGAGYLGVNGNAVRIKAFGTTAANSNTKRMRLYFGATVLADSGAQALNNVGWSLEAIVMRTGATAQVANGYAMFSGSVIDTGSSPAETLTNSITVKITGQNGSASANDIVAQAFTVEPINMV